MKHKAKSIFSQGRSSVHPILPSIHARDEVDMGKQDLFLQTTASSPTKYHDAEDPFYDVVRSRHPRSLNYRETDTALSPSYINQKEGENLEAIKTLVQDTKYRNKKERKGNESMGGKNALLNEIHNMRMKVFDDRQPANLFENQVKPYLPLLSMDEREKIMERYHESKKLMVG
jgi:hypothetical protein